MNPQVTTVLSALARSVERHSARIAVVTEDGSSLSYAELDAQRRIAARALLAHGVVRGDRIAIWSPNRLEWIVAGLAAHSIGAAIVPVNTRMKGAEAGDILARSCAKLLFCAGRFLDTDYPALLAPHRTSTLASVVVFDETRDGELSWQDFLLKADTVSESCLREAENAVQGSDLMDVMFTSGTTGRPKGVMTTQAQNLRTIAAWSAAVGLVPEDRYLIVNPFFHAFGYKVGWLGGVLAGLTVLPHAVFDAKAVLHRIARDRVSVLPGPPTLFVSLLNDPERASTDLSSLRATITGAAAIAPSLIERIRAELGFKLVLTGYGLTETCGVVSLCEGGDDAQTIALTSGKAVAGVEMRCVDPQNQPVPAGESGEIVVRGYNVMQGYLDDPAATRETIDADGWLHTGDIGVLDTRGYLRITDRLKDLYITGGFNCYPAEIERQMAAHPAIAQSAVVGVPDERLGEVGRAYVVLRPGQTLDEAALIAWCREQMANYKVPRSVVFVAQLPTNPSGKVLKYQLRDTTTPSS
ncbi:acyl-CoA synthetase (AMP-forming)/AMP-acid ligase II [Panacagrimonas perspica]|uniref:Acyl-CoA synthetase (AMP-forming)/AMP-acid ligase II n=1 Tax=Panacagrimonas perspica TaxID=381431 RepID=A0A4S3K1C6_9GAMM|nr:FadD3 family acyl-CoA ligase [Panacagrimonas perspica]TDU31126.1 acyl-CoA synthetase (AMP-forming)/AMP-acid ligase II [Panacagrimonas perspica]THD01739.1 fatty acid--CoA ligase [Panacagrimonas perspica]